MAVTMKQVREGSIVLVRTSFGNGPIKQVTVENVDPDIKRGLPGIEYEDSWAYLSQIDKVVKY